MDGYLKDIDDRIRRYMEQGEYSMALDMMETRKLVNEQHRRQTYRTVPRTDPPKEYLFLTVNPEPTVPLEEFRKCLDRMVAKVWFRSYLYVLEQRGTTPEEAGKGFHAHIIVKKPEDKVPSHVIRELVTTFKNVCSVSNPHCFNTKWIDHAEYNRKLGYLLGRKEFTEYDRKDIKQSMDRLWRHRASILNYYKSNIDIGDYGQTGDTFSTSMETFEES